MPHAGLDASRSSTGVIWCTERASEYGFLEDPESWANLGQGAPEVEDDIEGCFKRPESISLSVAAREYGPTAGIRPLREAVANLYNEMHRKGKDSLYTWENVAIVPGGRAGLIRIAAVLGNSVCDIACHVCGCSLMGRLVPQLLPARLYSLQRDVESVQERMFVLFSAHPTQTLT
jgi:hypothetical protein